MKSWCENILVVTMLCVLIEMLFPNGKNVKYLKVVLSIYLVFNILVPVLNFIDNKSYENFTKDFGYKFEESTSFDGQNVYLNMLEEVLYE